MKFQTDIRRVLLLFRVEYQFETEEGYEEHKQITYQESDQYTEHYHYTWEDDDEGLRSTIFYAMLVVEDTLQKMNYTTTLEQHYKDWIAEQTEQFKQEAEFPYTYTITWDTCRTTDLIAFDDPCVTGTARMYSRNNTNLDGKSQ